MGIRDLWPRAAGSTATPQGGENELALRVRAEPFASRTVTPEHAVEMFRAIPGAQLCVVPNARHGTLPTETILTFLQE
jgi:pimeloyl-ACP methyl ester carboxylesterase